MAEQFRAPTSEPAATMEQLRMRKMAVTEFKRPSMTLKMPSRWPGKWPVTVRY